MYPDRNPSYKYQGIFVEEQVNSLKMIPGIVCDILIIDGFKGKLHYLSGAIRAYLKATFGKYDVIHVHYGLSGLFLLLNPFKRTWNNVFITLHGGDILEKQGKNVQVWLSKQVVKHAKLVFSLNDEMDAILHVLGVRFIQLPCGSDEKLFVNDGRFTKEDTVVFPGRTERSVKNYSLFEKIIALYNTQHQPLKIVVLDGMSREQVRDALCKARLLLLTSVSEGSPQAIKEALLCDLAIVSSDVGDVKTVLGQTRGTRVFQHDATITDVVSMMSTAILESQAYLGERRQRVLDLGLDSDSVARKLVGYYLG